MGKKGKKMEKRIRKLKKDNKIKKVRKKKTIEQKNWKFFYKKSQKKFGKKCLQK